MKYQLTHFTRFIPATRIRMSLSQWMKVALWGMMAILLVLNIVTRFNSSQIVQSTNSVINHLSQAKKLWAQGHKSVAINELRKLNTKINVLGETTSDPPPTSSKQQEKEALNIQLKYWEDVVINYPDYRDAYLAIARLGYLLNKPDMVSENLRKAALLDPNGASINIFDNLTK